MYRWLVAFVLALILIGLVVGVFFLLIHYGFIWWALGVCLILGIIGYVTYICHEIVSLMLDGGSESNKEQPEEGTRKQRVDWTNLDETKYRKVNAPGVGDIAWNAAKAYFDFCERHGSSLPDLALTIQGAIETSREQEEEVSNK